MESDSAPAVSVIIPARNEERAIGLCLDSLCALGLPREEMEVIVLDNGSSDHTAAVARSFLPRLNLIVLERPGVHVSTLRNLGAARAHGRLLAFLDSDCVVPAGWTVRAAAWLEEPAVGVAGAHFRIPDDARWVPHVWYGDAWKEKQGELRWIPGCNLWVKRETFQRLGGFDDSIETNEDYEFCERVRRAGLKVMADGTIAVTHLEPFQTLGEFYRKTRWHGTDGLRVWLRAGHRWSEARPILFAFFTLACVIGTMACGLLAFRHLPGWWVALFPAAFLGLSFALSLRIAFRRGKPLQAFPLSLLHAVYGLGRARALFARRPS